MPFRIKKKPLCQKAGWYTTGALCELLGVDVPVYSTADESQLDFVISNYASICN